VRQTLGPGFPESVYQRVLLIELHKYNLATELEKEIVIYHDGQKVGRIDCSSTLPPTGPTSAESRADHPFLPRSPFPTKETALFFNRTD
jgi:hypothetical protein